MMQDKEIKKVGIIIPIYNVEKYLRECLESVVNQTYTNLSIVLINDASTDKSLEIAKEYALKDERIILIENDKNQGAGYSRNKGLEICSADYVLFFDADDKMRPNAIEALLNQALKTQADIVVAQADACYEEYKSSFLMKNSLQTHFIPEKEVFNYKDFKKYIFNFTLGVAWNKLYKRDFIIKNELLFQDTPSTNDAYFTMLSLVLAEKITCLKESIFIYNIHKKSITHSSIIQASLGFFEMLIALRNELKKRNLYQEVEQSYINYALGVCLWILDISKDSGAQAMFVVMKNYIFKRLEFYGRDKSYFYDMHAYIKLQKIKNSNEISRLSGAVDRVKHQLAYQLGQAIIQAKSVSKALALPFKILKIILKHKQEQRAYRMMIKLYPHLKLAPLEAYLDYTQALEFKEHLSYKLGEALIKSPLTFVFRVSKIYKEFKKIKQIEAKSKGMK